MARTGREWDGMTDNNTARPSYNDWLAQHTLLWGDHSYPGSALLHVSSKGDWTGVRLPLDDVDGAWDYAEDRCFKDVYVRVAPLDGDVEYEAGSRGRKDCSLALPALWLDVDTSDGVHDAENLPTMKEAGRIVRRVLAPSLIVKSGGGVHCYWRLDEPMNWTSAEGADLLRRWAALWKGEFATRGFDVDSGVSKDAGRILRMAGTLNGKFQEPRAVTIHEQDLLQSYSVDLLQKVAPPVAMLDSTAAARYVGGSLARRINHLVPASRAIADVWGLQLVDADRGRWALPQSTGWLNPAGNAQVWTDEKGTESVTAFTTRLQHLWRQEDEAHSLRTWDLLVIALGGDLTTAELVGKAFVKDADGLVNALKKAVAHRTVSE